MRAIVVAGPDAGDGLGVRRGLGGLGQLEGGQAEKEGKHVFHGCLGTVREGPASQASCLSRNIRVEAEVRARKMRGLQLFEGTMPFRYKGLAAAPFSSLFALGDAELAARGMQRMIVDEKPGFPCRISLEDAEPGERVVLLPFRHQTANSPYRASGPIFVREGAVETFDGAGALPPVLRERLLSVRAYDGVGNMVDADVVEGPEVETLLARLFARPGVDYAHIHFARRGCYACRVERA